MFALNAAVGILIKMSMSDQFDICELCERQYGNVSFIWHIAVEVFFCMLLILKYMLWDIYMVFIMPSYKKGPCKICRHSANWHLLSPNPYNFPLNKNATAFNLLMDIKFKLSTPTIFEDCIKCIINGLLKRKDGAGIHFYKKLSNLEYLENKYDRSDKR